MRGCLRGAGAAAAGVFAGQQGGVVDADRQDEYGRVGAGLLEPAAFVVGGRVADQQRPGVLAGEDAAHRGADDPADAAGLVHDEHQPGGVDALDGGLVVVGSGEAVGDHDVRSVAVGHLPLRDADFAGQAGAGDDLADVGPHLPLDLPSAGGGGDREGGAGWVDDGRPDGRPRGDVGLAGAEAARNGDPAVVDQRFEDVALAAPLALAEDVLHEADRVVGPQGVGGAGLGVGSCEDFRPVGGGEGGVEAAADGWRRVGEFGEQAAAEPSGPARGDRGQWPVHGPPGC